MDDDDKGSTGTVPTTPLRRAVLSQRQYEDLKDLNLLESDVMYLTFGAADDPAIDQIIDHAKNQRRHNRVKELKMRPDNLAHALVRLEEQLKLLQRKCRIEF